MSEEETDTDTMLIEGIGNEVITALTVAVVGVVPLIFYAVRNLHWSIGAGLWAQWIWQSPDNSTMAEVERIETVEPSQPSASASRRYTTDRCPICLQDHRLAIETNCGHVFCGMCLNAYYTMGNFLGPMPCPVCRQVITVLFACFTEEELHADRHLSLLGADRHTLQHRISDYNRRHSGEPRPLLDYLRDWPTLMRHLWNEFFSVGGLMLMFRIRILLCLFCGLVYFISPLDVIPEAMFGLLGLLDDFFVIFFLAIYISVMYRRLVANRDPTT